VSSVEGSSIHRTTLPSEYVCSALKTNRPAAGSGPSDTSNSWNWPGLTAAPVLAVHVIFETVSVISASCTLIGVASLDRTATASQPGTGLTETEATGASAGRFTSILVVSALSVSFGTRNVTFV
jgi:hypothetical protein